MSECCDLSKLSDEELASLRSGVATVQEERAKRKEEEYLGTDEFKALKKEYKALKKEYKALTRNHEFELTIPMKVKVKLGGVDLACAMHNGYVLELYDLFDVDFRVKVLRGDFDKDMRTNVQGVVEQACEELCGDLMFLNADLGKAVEAFLAKANEFSLKVEGSPADPDDLD